MDESWHGLIRGTVPVFAWRDRANYETPQSVQSTFHPRFDSRPECKLEGLSLKATSSMQMCTNLRLHQGWASLFKRLAISTAGSTEQGWTRVTAISLPVRERCILWQLFPESWYEVVVTDSSICSNEFIRMWCSKSFLSFPYYERKNTCTFSEKLDLYVLG